MIKTLVKSIREYKKPSILTPLVMVGEAVMEMLIPFIMSMLVAVIDGAQTLTGDDLRKVATYGCIMLLMALVSLFCGVSGGRLAAKASAGFAANLRKDMYRKIQEYSFSNIDKYATSSLITRLTTDVTNVQQSYQAILRMMVRAPSMFIMAIVMAFIISPKYASIFVCSAMVIAIVVVAIIFKVMPIFRNMFKKYDTLNAVAQENLIGVRVVKSYVREDYEISKYKAATNEVYKYSVGAEKWFVFMMPCVQIIMNIVLIWFVYTGGNEIIAGGPLTIDKLYALVTYALQILTGIVMIAMMMNFISMSKASADRIAEVLEEEIDLKNPENPITEVKDGSIRFENVKFAYGADKERAVLQNINLDIRSGETIGIIGGTGSAKTTLVSMIPRLYDVTEGSVTVGGVDVRDYDMEVLRNNVAVVLQKNVLFSGSITENLRWGDEFASDEEIRNAAKQAQAAEFIENIPEKYEYDLGQGGVNVSGGQKQRLCIARALLKKPKILIFDDSTSAVDTKTDSMIRDSLRRYAPDVTKLIIAQRIASVQDADRIIVLNDGCVNDFGTHEQLMARNEIYRDVYYSQIKGGDENATEK